MKTVILNEKELLNVDGGCFTLPPFGPGPYNPFPPTGNGPFNPFPDDFNG